MTMRVGTAKLCLKQLNEKLALIVIFEGKMGKLLADFTSLESVRFWEWDCFAQRILRPPAMALPFILIQLFGVQWVCRIKDQ
jgi:hypothetical protein